MNDQTIKRFVVLTAAAGLEILLPEVGNARHAIGILRLRVYDEIRGAFLRIIERYCEQLKEKEGCLMLVGINLGVLDQPEKTGLASKIGRENIFAARPRFSGSLFAAGNNRQAWLENLRDEQ